MDDIEVFINVKKANSLSNRFFQYISRIFGGGTVPKSGPSLEELLQKEILQDKTFFITGFKSFEVYFSIEFNDATSAAAAVIH